MGRLTTAAAGSCLLPEGGFYDRLSATTAVVGPAAALSDRLLISSLSRSLTPMIGCLVSSPSCRVPDGQGSVGRHDSARPDSITSPLPLARSSRPHCTTVSSDPPSPTRAESEKNKQR